MAAKRNPQLLPSPSVLAAYVLIPSVFACVVIVHLYPSVFSYTVIPHPILSPRFCSLCEDLEMNSYVNQIEDRDWDNSANGKARVCMEI